MVTKAPPFVVLETWSRVCPKRSVQKVLLFIFPAEATAVFEETPKGRCITLSSESYQGCTDKENCAESTELHTAHDSAKTRQAGLFFQHWE